MNDSGQATVGDFILYFAEWRGKVGFAVNGFYNPATPIGLGRIWKSASQSGSKPSDPTVSVTATDRFIRCIVVAWMKIFGATSSMDDSPFLPAKRVAILLGTWNGGSYLPQQLESYARQTHADWRLYVSDDGSSDNTLEIIEQFKARVPQRIDVIPGPRRGFAVNYLSLVKNPTVQGDYFAFSDQDDIWHIDKLERAIAWIAKIPEDVPALYFSRTDLIEAGGAPLGRSALFSRPPSFQNALVENIGAGNTMVFNRATKRLLEAIEGDIVSHDWAAYQLASAVGAEICYDPMPSLAYRQHTSNTFGSNRNLSGHLRRIERVVSGRFARSTETNICMLRPFLERMTPENRETLEFFVKAKAGPLPLRIYHLRRSGVYRQTCLGDLGLLTTMIFRRF